MKCVAVLCYLLSASLLLCPGIVVSKPYVPESDDVKLERVRSRGSKAEDSRIVELRKEVAEDPADVTNSIELAREYLNKSRRDSDPRYVGFAQAVLAPWWNIQQVPVEVMVLRATIRQNRHEFEKALEDLDLALADDPGHAQAWLTKATILLVQGRVDEAMES